VDAMSEGLGTEDGKADREELGEDSTDNNGLETVVGSHGDGDDLGLIAHLSSNEHHDKEDALGGTAAAEVLEFLSGKDHFLVVVMMGDEEAGLGVDKLLSRFLTLQEFSVGLDDCSVVDDLNSSLFSHLGEVHGSDFFLIGLFLTIRFVGVGFFGSRSRMFFTAGTGIGIGLVTAFLFALFA